MNDNKKRDIFYGVVAVATLIIALVGATLAYFSISVRSEEGAVNATAAIVSIEYNDGQSIIAQAEELIPATLEVVKATYEHNMQALNNQIDNTDPDADRTNVCTDSNGMEVCSIYRFSLKSDLTRTAKATLQSEYNGFEYLAYALRDVTNGSWVVLDANTNAQSIPLNKCDNSESDSAQRCYNTNDMTGAKEYNGIAKSSIFGYNASSEFATKSVGTTKQEYDLIIFIKENNENQNVDQGKQFSGTIVVDIIDDGAGRVSGQANW